MSYRGGQRRHAGRGKHTAALREARIQRIPAHLALYDALILPEG
jgi:hypothetical protein